MDLTKLFQEATEQAEYFECLYDALLTKTERAVRREWKERFYDAKLVKWAKRDELWRSQNDHIIMVGKKTSGINEKYFRSDCLVLLLKSALVSILAGIDKILHEAISNRFSSLAQVGTLDSFVRLDLSKSYKIARAARERKGKGGKIKPRPGHPIKAESLKVMYGESYLSLNRLQQVCAACGKNRIFTLYAKTITGSSAEDLQNEWNNIYRRRNFIVHECDIIRRSKMRIVRLNNSNPIILKKHIEFSKKFGEYLSQNL